MRQLIGIGLVHFYSAIDAKIGMLQQYILTPLFTKIYGVGINGVEISGIGTP